MTKVHKVDYDAKAFLLGVAGMPGFDIGVYWVACSLIYEGGKPIHIHDERLYRIIKSRAPDIDRAMERLTKAPPGREPKLVRSGDVVDNKTSRRELEAATKRIRSASVNATERWRRDTKNVENQQLENAGASEAAMLYHTTPLPVGSTPLVDRPETQQSGESVEGVGPAVKSIPPPPPKKPSLKIPDKSLKTRINPEWTPNERNLAYAVAKGLTEHQISSIAVRYKRHWLSPDAKRPAKADWDGTWENWIDRDVDDGRIIPERSNGPGQPNGNFRGSRSIAELVAASYATVPDEHDLSREGRNRFSVSGVRSDPQPRKRPSPLPELDAGETIIEADD